MVGTQWAVGQHRFEELSIDRPQLEAAPTPKSIRVCARFNLGPRLSPSRDLLMLDVESVTLGAGPTPTQARLMAIDEGAGDVRVYPAQGEEQGRLVVEAKRHAVRPFG